MVEGVWYRGMTSELDRGVEADEAELMAAGLVAGPPGVPVDKEDSGDSKSQVTPCLRQLPQVGWTSSH